MTKDERKYYDKIARLGCSLCHYFGYSETPCEIHHIRRFGGKRTLAEVIGLCPEHHRGNTGLHGLGRKGFENKYGIDEDFLLKQTKGLIYSV
jgi:hypothetical protein